MNETEYEKAKRELGHAFEKYKNTLGDEAKRVIKNGGYRCSFCNKANNLVKSLIAGKDKTFICNECIELCQEIINEKDKDI